MARSFGQFELGRKCLKRLKELSEEHPTVRQFMIKKEVIVMIESMIKGIEEGVETRRSEMKHLTAFDTEMTRGQRRFRSFGLKYLKSYAKELEDLGNEQGKNSKLSNVKGGGESKN